MREHLAAVAADVPEAFARLVGPPCPPLAQRAWGVFLELHGTRGSGGMGSVPAITYAEMAAYQAMTDTRLTPLDVACVRAADDAFLAHVADVSRPDDSET